MNTALIVTIVWLGGLIATPAVGADYSNPAGVNTEPQFAQQNRSTAGVQSSSRPAEAVLAGIAERERALGLGDQLDQLDFQEFLVWEQLIATLPAAALSPEIRDQENAMRMGALPLLTARQKAYRALELDLGRALTAATSSKADDASVRTLLARLASIREWSSLIEQAQRQTRTALDTVHAIALARAANTGLRLDAPALAALRQIGERRVRAEAAIAEATAAWEAQRDTARSEQRQHELGVAAALAQAGADNERESENLHRRAAAIALPASLRELLRGTADVLRATARMAGGAAADTADIVDGQANSFLAEPGKADPADTELAALLTERRRLAGALRASLAERATTLTELRSLAGERERVLAAADYLAPSEDRRRAHAALQRAAADAWRQVDELRMAAGDIASAAAGERARAAEWLGVKLEGLIALEEQLHTLAVGQLLDPFPRAADPRLASAATRWKRDVDALQSLDEKWTMWRSGWDERGLREEEYLAALRVLVGRTNTLRAMRIATLAATLPSVASDDDISRLTTGIVNNARAHAQAASRIEPGLRRLREDTEADPVASAVSKLASAFRWTHASDGLRDLPRLFDEIGRLRHANSIVPVALNPVLPAPQRLSALMWLSETLSVPWFALGSAQELRVTTELDGETYVLEGLAQNAPQLKRQREVFVGAPIRFMAMSTIGLQWAQAAAASPNASDPLVIRPDHPLLSPVPTGGLIPMSPRTLTLICYHTVKDVFDNRLIYLSMPVVGAAAGAYSGASLGPGGIYVGGKTGAVAGVIAVAPAVAEDALFGGAKGLIKGSAADFRRLVPAEYAGTRGFLTWVEQHAESGVDKLQAALALSSLVKRGIAAISPRGDKVTNAERLTGSVRGSIAEGQQSLAALSRQMSESVDRLMGSRVLSSAERLALENSLSTAHARAADVRKLVSDLRTRLAGLSPDLARSELVREWSRATAEILTEMNDLVGPDWAYAASARDLLASVLQSIRTASDPSAATGQTSADAGTRTAASDPERDRALALDRRKAQERSGDVAQRSAGAAVTRDTRPGSDQLLGSLDALQREMIAEWEQKKELEKLRAARDRDKEKEKDKEKGKDKDSTADTGEIKTPVKPDIPVVEPDRTDIATSGTETRYWWGYDAVISYQYKGASCTQTLSGQTFGTRAEAEQAMRNASDSALRADSANRSEVALVRRGLYAGPLPQRPPYPGPTGLKAVQCATVTTAKPPSAAAPAQQAYQWYMLEAVVSWTKNVVVADRKIKKVNCTATTWYARQLLQSEVPEALRKHGQDLLGPVRNYENARVVSTRVYQGPTATKPRPPVSTSSKTECGQPY